VSWEPAGLDRIRCTRHDVEFGKRETCSRCATDPPPPLTIEEPDVLPAAPKDCRSSEQHEQRLTVLAEFVETKARGLCTGKGRINYATAAKLFEVALKAWRAAGEYAMTRERRARVNRLERKMRELARGRAGGRN
jgi:hypothetical protein